MSLRQTLSDIDKLVIGIEVQEAVDLVVKYILETEQYLHSKESAYSYWSGLSEDEKLQILLRALRQR